MPNTLDSITLAWITLPLFLGFVIYLLPSVARQFTLVVGLVSAAYAFYVFQLDSVFEIQLLDSAGVSLTIDRLSAWFILTNAVVTMAVLLYCWRTGKSSFFYTQLAILHGSVNATFICADFISQYVALEVISIAAFSLITYPRSDRTIWVGLRYLFVSNTVMLFYLIGAVLVYKANGSFAYRGLLNSPPEAIALIFLGLLAKGGVFVSGLWLPLTHSESATPVSAMLSGVVVKAGVFPLLRCALLLEAIEPTVRMFGVATAVLGVTYAMLETDTKRTLAFSTVSQLGFVLAAPVAGGFYAFTHGLAKSCLFLIAGNLPSRNFQELRERGVEAKIGLALIIASLSISGFPLVAGFGAKVSTTKSLFDWQEIIINIATVGTAITFAKFIFLNLKRPSKAGLEKEQKIQPGFWWAMFILLGGLIVGNVVSLETYAVENLLKSLVIIAIGWGIYFLAISKSTVKLPRAIERFEHLIGSMSLVLILVFWIVQIQFNASSQF